MSRGVTVTILGGLLLTACLTSRGCRRHSPDYTWYDASGNVIATKYKTDATGKKMPDPHPYDRYHQLWVYDANGNLVPPNPPPGTSSHRSGGFLFWGGSGYRSSGGSSGSSSSSSTISRGGFGSTGMSSGS